MKKNLLLILAVVALGFVAAPKASAGISIGIGVPFPYYGYGYGYPAYYGGYYPAYYGYGYGYPGYYYGGYRRGVYCYRGGYGDSRGYGGLD